MENNIKACLLNDLADKIGCKYLSDLHTVNAVSPIGTAVAAISPDRYTLDQWAYAINYITNNRKTFATPEDAKNFIKQWADTYCPRL